MTIKIWKRSTDVDSMNPNSGPPPEQDIPLQVPKKTKLYVEQVMEVEDVIQLSVLYCTPLLLVHSLTHLLTYSLAKSLDTHTHTHTDTHKRTLMHSFSRNPHTLAPSDTHALSHPTSHLTSPHLSMHCDADPEGERARP